ncbi:hypothetical protein Ple7327_4621 [Pleurocapsa sp. PCC 7327]|uniref:hypothetical protein n=1 Tax=Pleurocapsa sp. PCC 7327 TaxID=118163 RepID=UPI00029F95FF|nr:hypothetical protein [Pleurocapsa sp. PCC 7327]AFY79715.1 hypothetical protein Ple7327_4621 [Pleurocapsa sp. PCC 7327]
MRVTTSVLPSIRQQQSNRSTVIWFLLAYTFLFILAQLPIWLNEFLPLQDYPNHLARMYVLLNYHNDPDLQKYYQVNFMILPNLAMDIIVPFLAKFVGLDIAGRLMLVLNIFMLTGGSAFLSYALFRRINFWSLMTFMAVYNQAFIINFINFLFGTGLALWCIGIWILMRENKTWLRLVLFSCLISILFICHLYGFGIYGLVVVSYEIYSFFKQRSYFKRAIFQRLLVLFGQFIIPAILYLSSPTSGGETIKYLTPVITKLKYVKMRMTDNYSLFLDNITIILILFIPIVGLLLKKLRLSQYMILPLCAVTVAYFVIPAKAVTSSHADWRILVPLFFLFLSSIEFNSDKLFNRAILGLLIVVFSVRIFVINSAWNAVQGEYREILTAIEHIEKGSRLFSARAFKNYYATIPFIHAPTYATIEKSAFVPSFFAFETQQPVEFQAKYVPLAEKTMATGYEQGKGVRWKLVLDNYDYVLISNEKLMKKVPKSNLQSVFQSPHVHLYKVKN